MEEFGDNYKKGYLKEDFKFFHLKDNKDMDFKYHYHDFNKIIIFISGDVTYLIEGKAYKLKPLDMLLVNSNAIHKPVINSEKTYERIVIWVNSSFLNRHNSKNTNLLNCFQIAQREKFNLFRLDDEDNSILRELLSSLENACFDTEFGSEVLRNSIFLQFIVYINRLFLGGIDSKVLVDVKYDEDINKILEYINKNLKEDLSINSLASRFYLNKYYLMHKFKEHTGVTVHKYVQNKRLIMAKDLIEKGKNISLVCAICGFGDYSNFIRSFKKFFGMAPKSYYKKK
ncbi:AraC family transcriptional regulator [Haloimpatiens sp. FM7315]|uniref:AraC family transcriptional regulator n=1 Tax=Haloimpatiens sp. FM7315 TaxID=3298609 RepID=UPI00370A1AF7